VVLDCFGADFTGHGFASFAVFRSLLVAPGEIGQLARREKAVSEWFQSASVG